MHESRGTRQTSTPLITMDTHGHLVSFSLSTKSEVWANSERVAETKERKFNAPLRGLRSSWPARGGRVRGGERLGPGWYREWVMEKQSITRQTNKGGPIITDLIQPSPKTPCVSERECERERTHQHIPAFFLRRLSLPARRSIVAQPLSVLPPRHPLPGKIAKPVNFWPPKVR